MTTLDGTQRLPSPDGASRRVAYTRDAEPGTVYEHDRMLIHPAYDDLFDWVFDWFLPTTERRVADGSQSGIYWCAQWWAHPEGLQRVYCLWREWEKARAEHAMSHWWRDHLDQHLLALTGEHGPFARCSPSRHYPPMHLSSQPVPEEVVQSMPEHVAEDRTDSTDIEASNEAGGHV